MSEHYTTRGLRCGNCGWRQASSIAGPLKIPKGQMVKDTPCPSCDCKALSKGLA